MNYVFTKSQKHTHTHICEGYFTRCHSALHPRLSNIYEVVVIRPWQQREPYISFGHEPSNLHALKLYFFITLNHFIASPYLLCHFVFNCLFYFYSSIIFLYLLLFLSFFTFTLFICTHFSHCAATDIEFPLRKGFLCSYLILYFDINIYFSCWYPGLYVCNIEEEKLRRLSVPLFSPFQLLGFEVIHIPQMSASFSVFENKTLNLWLWISCLRLIQKKILAKNKIKYLNQQS